MALNLSNITYDGKDLGIGIVKDSFNHSTIHEVFGARIIQGIKSKGYWFDSSLDITINEYATCPAFNTNLELNQNTIELCTYSVSGKLEHNKLVGTLREVYLRQGVLNEATDQDTELFDAFVMMLTDAVNQAQGEKFLTATEYAGDCADGLLAQFEDDSLARPVPSTQRLTAASITPSTVQTELSRVINAMPSKFKYGANIRGMEKPKIAVSAEIMDAYLTSLTYQAPTSAAGAQGADVSSEGKASYRGYELVVVYGLAADEMFMTAPSNIALVFDDANDLMNLIIKNGLDDSTLCAVLAYRLDWRAGIMFGDGDKVVYYR